MRVKLIDNLGQPPVELPAQTVIVEDDFGNPLLVACQLATQQTMIATIDDANFQRVLESLGIHKVVINTRLKPVAPPAGAKLLLEH